MSYILINILNKLTRFMRNNFYFSNEITSYTDTITIMLHQKLFNVITLNVISCLLRSHFKVAILTYYYIIVTDYCYHLVIVISFSPSQSDHIKQISLSLQQEKVTQSYKFAIDQGFPTFYIYSPPKLKNIKLVSPPPPSQSFYGSSDLGVGPKKLKQYALGAPCLVYLLQ